MHGIFGVRPIAEHIQRYRIQSRAMTFQQQAEATTIAAPSGNGQFGIGRQDMSLTSHGLKMRQPSKKFES
ncbi:MULTISPECIES: hypothetical protein [Mesorhizobium]|uniref:hypothetical protein n=1 Tax=Mesorhizobium TaxID=68287 RepID=UPI001FE4B919|nr:MULTISPECIES: hypothetical protein [Mesorhizobium]